MCFFQVNEIKEEHSAGNVSFCDTYDKTEVCVDELLFGVAVAVSHTLRKLTLYDFLAADRPESEYAMVGFRLKNTVTEHGSVARGVCEVENGLLQGVTERTKIVKRGEDAAFTEDDGETWTDLSGDTLVSMNFWGFTPRYLYELARRFPAFLENEVPKNPLKSEYFVPSVVNAQLQEGSAAIAVLDTPDAWHGVTYPEDLPGVKAALKTLTDAGTYPEGFWK